MKGQYRILKISNLYYPQYKFMWVWWHYYTTWPFVECFYTQLVSFDTEEEARKFLDNDPSIKIVDSKW